MNTGSDILWYFISYFIFGEHMVKKTKRERTFSFMAHHNENKTVLVGVIKDRRDLKAFLSEQWYRIPVASAPKKKSNHLAVYQPAGFGSKGKQIFYYGRIVGRKIVQRKHLLPDEPHHPRAHDSYLVFRVGRVKTLSRPIRNTTPRRVLFGFTTMHRLLHSKDLLQLYDIAPLEQMVGNALHGAGIKTSAQQYVSSGKKRFYVDFAVRCRKGAIAIECDNRKAHASSFQKQKDKAKNKALKHCGWTVIRLSEKAVVSDLDNCVFRVKKAMRKLGGRM